MCVYLLWFQHGLIRTNDTEYFVEPLHNYPGYVAEGHPHVIYKRSTLPRQHEEVSCGVSGKHSVFCFCFFANTTYMVLLGKKGKSLF